MPRYIPESERPARFWAQVAIAGPDDCWFWQGACVPRSGYGATQLARLHTAHRSAYYFTNPKMKLESFICHTCADRYPPGDISYRACCNPAHLYEGTAQSNSDDTTKHGRRRPRGSAIRAGQPPRMSMPDQLDRWLEA